MLVRGQALYFNLVDLNYNRVSWQVILNDTFRRLFSLFHYANMKYF